MIPFLVALLAGCASLPEADPCAVDGVICTQVGTGSMGFNGEGLAADASMLYWPSAARFDPDDRLVIADLNNYRVRRMEYGQLVTILGNGFHLGSSEGLRATDTPVDFPIDVRFLPDGSFYVAATHEARILYVDTGGYLHHVVGDGNLGYTGDGGPARDARLSAASGIALDEDGTLYIADTENHCLRAVLPDGTIETLAGRGLPGFGGDGGDAAGALFDSPTGLTLDGTTLYVADTGNHVVRAIDLAEGTIRTVVGLGAQGWSGDGGPATQATLYSPESVAIAPDGSMWIADAGNNRLRRVTPDGIIETVAGTGEPGFAGDGGPAEDARFTYPTDVAFGPDGHLYVSDMANGAVRIIHGADSW